MARPASGRSSVARMRTAVVLPAPLGPRSPSTVPARAAKSTPHSACTEPYDFFRPSTTMASSVSLPMRRTLVARGRRFGTENRTPRVPDEHRLGHEVDAEAIVHAARDLAREGDELRGRAGAAVREGERVLARDRDAARVALAAVEARALDEPRRGR